MTAGEALGWVNLVVTTVFAALVWGLPAEWRRLLFPYAVVLVVAGWVPMITLRLYGNGPVYGQVFYPLTYAAQVFQLLVLVRLGSRICGGRLRVRWMLAAGLLFALPLALFVDPIGPRIMGLTLLVCLQLGAWTYLAIFLGLEQGSVQVKTGEKLILTALFLMLWVATGLMASFLTGPLGGDLFNWTLPAGYLISMLVWIFAALRLKREPAL